MTTPAADTKSSQVIRRQRVVIILLATVFLGSSPTICCAEIKCGRDCIYLAISLLGGEASLDEIDQELGGNAFVSLSDLRGYFVNHGYYCKSYNFHGDELRRLDLALRQSRREISAIAYIRPAKSEKDDQPGHFAVVLRANEQFLTLIDTSTGSVQNLELQEGFLNQGLPIMIVGSEPEQLQLAKPSLLHFAAESGEGVFRSRWTTGALLVFFAFAILPQSLSFVRLARQKAIHSVPGLFRLVARPALVVGICAVALVALTISFNRYLKPPQLAVDATVRDLGKIEVGHEITTGFVLHNRGNEPIQIRSVRTSCSCVTAEPSHWVIPAAGHANLTAKLIPSVEGEMHYEILVQPDNPDVQAYRLKLDAVGYESVRLSPMTANVGEFPEDQNWSKQVAFRVDGHVVNSMPVEAVRPRGESSMFVVELVGDQEVKTDGQVVLKLSHEPQKDALRLEDFFEDFVVEAKNPTKSHRFAVRIHGKFVPSVFVLPDEVVLQRQEASSLASASILVRSPFSRIASYESSCSNPDDRITVEPSPGSHELSITIQRSKPSSSGEDILSIDLIHEDGTERELKVPIFGPLDGHESLAQEVLRSDRSLGPVAE